MNVKIWDKNESTYIKIEHVFRIYNGASYINIDYYEGFVIYNKQFDPLRYELRYIFK